MRYLFLILTLFCFSILKAQTVPQINNVPWYQFTNKLTVKGRLQLPADTFASATVLDTGSLANKNGTLYLYDTVGGVLGWHPAAVSTALLDSIRSTGVFSGSGVSINGGDNTKFDIDVSGVIKDPLSGTAVYITKTATAQTVTNLASQNVTYVSVDASGTIIQQSTPWTPTQRFTQLTGFVLVHSNRTNLNAVNNLFAVGYNGLNQLQGFMDVFGMMNVNGNVFSGSVSNLSINKTAGNVHRVGANETAVSQSPNRKSLGALTAATFRYRLQTGAESVDTGFINPNVYDNGGNLTAVPTNKWTVQHIAIFVSNLVRIQRGQTVYDSKEAALLGIQNNHFAYETNISENGLIRAYLVVQQGTTNFSDENDYAFVESSKFGFSTGGGAGGVVDTTVIASKNYVQANFWNLAGNGLTATGTMGTTSNFPVRFITNNAEVFALSTGQILTKTDASGTNQAGTDLHQGGGLGTGNAAGGAWRWYKSTPVASGTGQHARTENGGMSAGGRYILGAATSTDNSVDMLQVTGQGSFSSEVVRVNALADTLATKAYARSVGGSNLTASKSLVKTGSDLTLVNDETTPKKGYFYGAKPFTDSARGYHEIEENSLGNIYATNTWSSLSDFTTNGATASVVSSKINFSGGAGTYTQTLDFNRYTMLDNWKVVAKVKVTEKSANSYGFGVGKRSYNAGALYDAWGSFDATSTGGKVYLHLGSAHTQFASSGTLSFSVNDYIIVTIERSGFLITATAQNFTTNSDPISVSYTFTSSAPYMDNTGKYSVISLGGTFTVDSMGISSQVPRNSRLMVIGDSKTQGYNATATTNRFCNLLNATYRSTVLSGGASDRTQEVSARIAEILDLRPQQVIMTIGSNDVRTGVAEATREARYDSIVTALQNAGIDVFHMVLHETSADLSTLVAHIAATYPANKIIDTYNAMQNAGSGVLAGDNAHLTDYGNTVVYNTVVSYGRLYAGNTRYAAQSPVATSTPGGTNKQVQYNNNGVMAGTANVSYDNSTNRLIIGGNTSGSYDVELNRSTNGPLDYAVINGQNGTAATAQFRAVNNAGNASQFGISSGGYTPYGTLTANTSYVYGQNDLALMADNGGKMTFGTNTAAVPVERMRITNNGQLRFNSYTSATAFSGTPVATLAVDASGNIITNSQLKASQVIDFASTSDNSSQVQNVTVTGAAVGDQVLVTKTSGVWSNGEIYIGYVSATNTVTIRFQNVSGGTQDPGSDTFNVTVIKF